MKKVLAAVLAAVVMAASLTGCAPSENNSGSQSNNSSSADNSSSSSSSDSSSSESSSSDSSSSESSSSDNSSSDSSSNDSSSNESSSSENNSSSDPVESQPSGGYDTANDYGLELPNSRAGELAAKLLAADSFGNIGLMDEVGVQFVFSEDISFDMLEDYCFLYPAISFRKLMIFIAKPKKSNEAAVKAIFDEKYDYFKNDPNAAFYEQDKIDVQGAVTGVTSDGYYYLIVHPNGSDIQNAIA